MGGEDVRVWERTRGDKDEDGCPGVEKGVRIRCW